MTHVTMQCELILNRLVVGLETEENRRRHCS